MMCRRRMGLDLVRMWCCLIDDGDNGIYEKSGSAGNEFVALETVGVRVGVACCGRGLKEGGSGGMVVGKVDVISGITVIGTVKKRRCLAAWFFMMNGAVHQGSNLIVNWRKV
ncbi:hypothetical protein Tco_0282800 [Tanacetum coccineum]